MNLNAGASQWRVQGMTCQNCARQVREAAQSVPGVASASVDLGAARLRVRWEPAATNDAVGVVKAVTGAGFEVSEWVGSGDRRGGEGEPEAPGREWRGNVLGAGGVSLFLALAEWVFGWGHTTWFPWVAGAMAGLVQGWAGARFYRGAWNQLKRGAANMDTLVSLGSTAAFAHSAWILVAGRGGHVHFLDSTAIIALISVGHWMEALASSRAAGAIRALMELAPARALRVEADGSTRSVPAEDVLPGDRVVVGPGDRVPADAEIVEGAASLDESMLTGESVPVERKLGDRVWGGTLNQDGRVVIRVTASGDGTVLAGIIAAVERAQGSRADIQRLADRISSVFVPVVVGLAVLTAVLWGFAPAWMQSIHQLLEGVLGRVSTPSGVTEAAISHAVAVLIIACPCAMGLATPIAIMAGANAAALRGILIRDGVALEKAGRIDTVLFDKTGSLTEGRMTLEAVEDLRPAGASLEPLESLAASLARRSSHPVSRALVAAHDARSTKRNVAGPVGLGRGAALGGSAVRLDFRLPGLGGPRGARSGGEPREWAEWRELRGCGIEARMGAAVYRLGSPSWLRESGVSGTELTGNGGAGVARTVVEVALDDRLLGRLLLTDPLRAESAGVVARLRQRGFAVGVLSGDVEPVVREVAAAAGMATELVFGGVRAEGKAEILARLQREGRRVAFVGDGLNDGPALAQADLGIAVGGATDLARASADLVLLRPGLAPLVEAIGIAQKTLRVIHQNLFWAFFYNAVAVPLAMLGFFSPILCAAAMGVSDLIVVGNALRLRRSIEKAK